MAPLSLHIFPVMSVPHLQYPVSRLFLSYVSPAPKRAWGTKIKR